MRPSPLTQSRMMPPAPAPQPRQFHGQHVVFRQNGSSRSQTALGHRSLTRAL